MTKPFMLFFTKSMFPLQFEAIIIFFLYIASNIFKGNPSCLLTEITKFDMSKSLLISSVKSIVFILFSKLYFFIVF